MATLETYFFHDTTKKYTGVVGSLFNNIRVKKGAKEILVPIAYSDKQKWKVKRDQDPDGQFKSAGLKLPMLGYRLTGLEQDRTRATQKQHKLIDTTAVSTDQAVQTQLNRVPYNFHFELYTKAKNMGELMQIAEQIVVYFNPSVDVVIRDNDDLNKETTINILMNAFDLQIDTEGDFESTSQYEATGSFTLKGYLYMPTTSSSRIQQVTVNMSDVIDVQNNILDTVVET